MDNNEAEVLIIMVHNPVLENARIPYETCPLCFGGNLANQMAVDCQMHPLYHPDLPSTMQWRVCLDCEHSFIDGYFSDEALSLLFGRTNIHQTVGENLESDRYIWAKVVERVSRYLAKHDAGVWLDVGFGNGSLLFTAAEWGFESVGVDLRNDNVEALRQWGVEAHAIDLTELDFPERFDVISMADVLEHLPFPGKALEACFQLLKPDGILFLSMPNTDAILWQIWNAQQYNPYWSELEHYHNFSRKRLYALLEQFRFTPFHYYVSERYRCGMEVLARKSK